KTLGQTDRAMVERQTGRLHRWRDIPSHKGEHRRKRPSHPPHEPKVGRSTILYAYMSNGENQTVKASALLMEQPESNYFGDLLGVLNEEELIRLRRRLEKTVGSLTHCSSISCRPFRRRD